MVAQSRQKSRARSQSRDRGRARSQSRDRGRERSQSRDRGRGRNGRGREVATRSSKPEKRGTEKGGSGRNRSLSRGRGKNQTAQIITRTRSKSKPRSRGKNEVRDKPDDRFGAVDQNYNKFVQYKEFGTNATLCCRVIAIDQIPEVTERWMVLVKVKVSLSHLPWVSNSHPSIMVRIPKPLIFLET